MRALAPAVLLAATLLAGCGSAETSPSAASPEPNPQCTGAQASRDTLLASPSPELIGEASHRNKVRTAAHLIADSPDCFTATEVAMAKTFLDTALVPTAEDYRCEAARAEQQEFEQMAMKAEQPRYIDGKVYIGYWHGADMAVLLNQDCFGEVEIRVAKQYVRAADLSVNPNARVPDYLQ